MDLSHFEPINANIKSWLNLDDWRGCQSNEFKKRIQIADCILIASFREMASDKDHREIG